MPLDRIIRETIKNSKFVSDFPKNCFRLIIEAYQTELIERNVALDWNENDISAQLNEYMRINPLRQQYRISINVEAHIPNDEDKVKGYSNMFSRVDFRMSTFGKYAELEYYFEAKKLKETDSKLKRLYINEGMQRFINGKYPLGSMLGYLLQGNEAKTIEGINKLLTKDGRQNELLSSKNHFIFQSYYESDNHQDIGLLKHLILDFT